MIFIVIKKCFSSVGGDFNEWSLIFLDTFEHQIFNRQMNNYLGQNT